VVVLTAGWTVFYVDGNTIPDVDWDVGPSWAGLLPISANTGETKKVGQCQPTLSFRFNAESTP
jgi:hypothetical protein